TQGPVEGSGGLQENTSGRLSNNSKISTANRCPIPAIPYLTSDQNPYRPHNAQLPVWGILPESSGCAKNHQTLDRIGINDGAGHSRYCCGGWCFDVWF